MLAGAERIIEKDFEIEFEKELRNPAVEDTSLNDASLNEASLRAFNARAHTRIENNLVALPCLSVVFPLHTFNDATQNLGALRGVQEPTWGAYR